MKPSIARVGLPVQLLTVLWLMPFTAAAFGADAVSLKPSIQIGQAWTFDQTQDSSTNNKATLNGQTSPFTSVTHSHHTGKVEIISVKAGLPTSMRISFDADCADSTAFAGQPAQPTPFVYAGKTITVSRADNGEVTDDFAGQADPSSTGALHSMLDEQAVFFPKQPVSVGDEWPADPQALSRALELAGNDNAGMTLKLLSIKQVGGRPTAEIKVSVAANKQQGGIQSQLILQGISLVDLQTGHSIRGDLAGTIKLQGQQTSNGPDGNPATYQVEGSGTLTTSGTSDFTTGGVAPAPTNANPVASAGNPLAPTPAPSGFTGKFTSDTLTLDGSQSADDYTGSIQLGQSKYPAKAKINGQSMEGSFDAAGSSFPFTAALDGDTINLSSGGKSYSLKRSAPAPVNPLDPGAP